ncbi:MAG: SH3 domain-containing protein [Treponema sp.]|nr:SH3 domain-containing protein [Treponema sp.]
MRRTVMYILITFLCLSTIYSQSLYYRYEKYDDHNQIYCIRIYRVLDDVNIEYSDYTMDELVDGPLDYYRTTILTDVNNNYISFYREIHDFNDSIIPIAQYKIDEHAKLVRTTFDENKSTRKLIGNSLAATERYGNENNKNELDAIAIFGNKNNIKPYNGWDFVRRFFKLDNSEIYFFRSYCESWLIKKVTNGYKINEVDERLFNLGGWYSNAVCYSENKVAFVDDIGNVQRIDITDFFHPKKEYSLWNKFTDALVTKKINQIDNIFNHQLYPTDFKEEEKTKYVIKLIAETKDPDIIVNCFKSIDKTYGIPYPRQGGLTNPIYEIINLNDAKSLNKVLEWNPELANINTFYGQFDEPDPARIAVEKNDIEVVRVLLSYLKDVNAVKCLSDKEADGGGMYNNYCNLLSFAKSDEMKKMLIEYGVKTFIPYTSSYERNTYVNDDNVNIRESASISGNKIDKVNKGIEAEVIGIDPYYYNIDDYYGHWVKIKYGEGKTGFIFEKYLKQWRR